METVYDLLRKLVEDHRWVSEAERVTAHGVINRADPNYSPPVSQAPQNLTHEQMMIQDLQRQLAEARGGQLNVPQNAAQQWQTAYGPQPASAAAANPQEMRGYSYPVPNAQGQPAQQPTMAPPPGAYPQQMQQYAYPMPQPETGYQPVANPFAQ